MNNLKRITYQLFNRFNTYGLTISICCLVATILISITVNAQPLSVRVNRWLELRNLSGTVDFLQNGQWSRAQIGQRLGRVGDGVRTGPGSLARLALDTQLGFIGVSENTDLRITELYTTSRGGKVTQLSLSRGQARVFVRPFTNPDSRLEFITPAHVNGIRGTDFGIAVQPNGRAALAVTQGSVACAAQGQSVAINGGFQAFTIPGEEPCELIEPLADDPSLNISRLERRNRRGRRTTTVALQGQTSPLNLFLVDDKIEETDREGNFDLLLPLPSTKQFQVKVITPLGTELVYELVVP